MLLLPYAVREVLAGFDILTRSGWPVEAQSEGAFRAALAEGIEVWNTASQGERAALVEASDLRPKVQPSLVERLGFLGECLDAESLRVKRLRAALEMMSRTFTVETAACSGGCGTDCASDGGEDDCDCGYMTAVEDPVGFIQEALDLGSTAP